MATPLVQGKTLDDLAELLYDFLPGQPHPYADQTISFPGVALDLGIEEFWQGGGKRPALRKLLEAVLTQKSNLFTVLLVRIVERSMSYRRTRNPICREEIEKLNALTGRLGFKAPELHDPEFLESLPKKNPQTTPADRPKAETETGLKRLREQFDELRKMDPQKRGFGFERFLNVLFENFELAPRESFRLVGEQIDGSFQLAQDVYVVEAKWQNHETGEADLLVLSGKVEGKAQWSRGLFISYTGFSKDGLEAFARGKSTRIICMNGLDIHYVLTGHLNLGDVINRKARRAGETNNAFTPVTELYPTIPI